MTDLAHDLAHQWPAFDEHEPWVVPLRSVGMADIGVVGGKNASLGEMLGALGSAGVRVPDGFATTAAAFRSIVAAGLQPVLDAELADLDADDVTALAAAGRRVREHVLGSPLPARLEAEVRTAYAGLSGPDGAPVAVAVRSSATAEDLPEASFAGQQETYLNIIGIDAVLDAARRVFASLYNDRAIAYRAHHGYARAEVALSVGVQRMVRSDLAAAGVLFTVDTETGFEDAVFVTSSYGLGEAVVQGAVDPDEWYVHKPALRAGRPAVLKRGVGSKAVEMVHTDDGAVGRTTAFVDVPPERRRLLSLTDAEVEELARCGLAVEEHYGRAMDVEWAKDGVDGQLYVVQARPETVQSRTSPATGGAVVQRYALDERPEQRTEVLAEGRAIGQRIGAGPVRVLHDPGQMASFRTGEVLVASMTDPDWEPIMKRAAGIVTDRGGRTCHAAIIARELGIPAVVGTGSGTSDLTEGQEVTVVCAEGDTGQVYAGALPFTVTETSTGAMPELPVRIMMNVGTPDQAFAFSRLPHAGVGLARLEFVINRQIGVHPRALLDAAHRPEVLDSGLRARIETLTAAYPDPRSFFVQRVAEGVAMIAAAFAPEPVIVRLSDFKSNEYAHLLGGSAYEPVEENPMIGYRGAARYLSEGFAACFAMECEALRHVREAMGLTNVKIMVPFVRTVTELEGVIDLLAAHGLRRGEHGLEVVMMCEVPSNALLADAFLDHVDGFSIGSNDLTQLTLGVDRDSALVAGSFDELDGAVLALMERAITACRARGKYVGICGQGPSDQPELADWLLDQGIESMSLNPDTVVDTWLHLAKTARET